MPRMGQSQAKEVTASWQCCTNSIARSLSCSVSGGCAPVFVVDMSWEVSTPACPCAKLF